MPYWQLYYHIVFATQDRRPCLAPAAREAACRLIRQKAQDLGCAFHAVQAQPDHVHLVLSIPPSLAVGTAIGQVKGSSSHALAAMLSPDVVFAWQEGYSLFSFGKRHLPNVVGYVRDQDRRHNAGDLWPELERTTESSNSEGELAQSRTTPELPA